MATNSKIEWTEATWNPVTGCTKISSGCKNCYAERMAKRLKAMGQKNYAHGFSLRTHQKSLKLPLLWRKPQIVFVNSMSDLFHEDVPVDFIQQVFKIMAEASWHRFQVLTKRSERLMRLSPSLPWASNIWMGVTVESQDYLQRVADLKVTGASIKFLSMEPLLSGFERLDLQGIDWLIAGGESGPRARPANPDWVRSIRDECIRQRVPFFFKQWGGTRKKAAGRLLDGRIWDEMPR
jgi:protein gp37